VTFTDVYLLKSFPIVPFRSFFRDTVFGAMSQQSQSGGPPHNNPPHQHPQRACPIRDRSTVECEELSRPEPLVTLKKYGTKKTRRLKNSSLLEDVSTLTRGRFTRIAEVM